MAAVPASLNVNFTSNYTGNHRICYRIGNAGPYNCSTVVACAGSGAPCSGVIAITVDNETCDPVTYEGYVQAECEDIASLNGRVPFTITFTPVPTCASYNVTCSSVGIASISVTNPGGGYDPLNPPALNIVGTGTGTVANAVVGNGGIKTETITNGGTGYNGGGSAVFLGVSAVNITGVGTGALYDVTVTAGVITAIALTNTPTAPGSGYAIGDTFTFNNAQLGGSGSGGIITVATLNTGEIQYVNVSNPGSGYSVLPLITVDASPCVSVPCSNATVEAVLAPCDTIDNLLNCGGGPSGVTITGLTIGQSFITCNTGAPTLPTGYTVTPQGCCYDCISITVTKDIGDSGNSTLYYRACDTRALTEVNVTPGFNQTYCVVAGSYVVVEAGDATSVVEGALCP